jgi:FAD/FMN-containing dehydrogenase
MPTLTNWNQQIRFDVPPERFVEPDSIAQVQEIVKRASERGDPVKAVGALHSTTECMVGSGVVLSMAKMNRVLAFDRDRQRVTVEAGVTLNQLCSALKPMRLQPGVILEFGNFQIGAISGTHANDTSVSREAQFSSFVVGFKLVTPAGEVLEISETENTGYVPFLRSHFGLFGVVCEVTLQVFESQPLRIKTRTSEISLFLDHFAEELRDLKTTQDQVFGMLFPHTGKLLWECRKYGEPTKPGDFDLASLDDSLQRRGVSVYKDVLLPLVKTGTAFHNADLARLLSRLLVEVPLGLFRHNAYTIDPCERGVIYAENDPDFDFYDWVFPEASWCDMVRAFLELSQQFEREQGFVLPLPALIYFIRQDRASQLSRSRRADMLALDPTYPDPADPTWKAFRLAFNQIAMEHGGIPHINKTRDGAIHHYADACDADALKEYLQMRRQFDPQGLFLNDHFRAMFSRRL